MQNQSGTYTVHDWASDVESTLNSIPSLDEVVVSGFDAVRGDNAPTWRNPYEQILNDLPYNSMHRGGRLRPHPVRGQIRFTVNIPAHIQSEVFPRYTPLAGNRFEVDIRYGYGMPVAFVRAPEGEVSPSMSVAVVREFLRSEFETRLGESPIKFTCMGPSPMWNDCFVRWGASEQSQFVEVEIDDPPGYRQITFKIQHRSQGKTLTDAYERLKDEMQDELTYYYELVSRNSLLDLRDSFVESELGEIVAHHQRGGVRAWLWRRFVGERRTNNLLLEILATDSEHRRSMGSARSDWEEILARSTFRAFDVAFERELNERLSDHLENARAVASLLNERHSRETQLVAVVFASLLGGVAGSAITALVRVLS